MYDYKFVNMLHDFVFRRKFADLPYDQIIIFPTSGDTERHDKQFPRRVKSLLSSSIAPSSTSFSIAFVMDFGCRFVLQFFFGRLTWGQTRLPVPQKLECPPSYQWMILEHVRKTIKLKIKHISRNYTAIVKVKVDKIQLLLLFLLTTC